MNYASNGIAKASVPAWVPWVVSSLVLSFVGLGACCVLIDRAGLERPDRDRLTLYVGAAFLGLFLWVVVRYVAYVAVA